MGSRIARWALPAELAGLPPGRRTARDWAVDAALFGFAAVIWAVMLVNAVIDPEPGYVELVPGWMRTIDPWLGAASCLALWWRRRFPLLLAIAMVPALALCATATGAMMVSIFTLAIHRGWLSGLLVTLAQIGQVVTFTLVERSNQESPVVAGAFAVSMCVVPYLSGLMVRFRRQLILSLRRDAERRHERRLTDARRTERERIAREMHDVLAHRISLLSVHAGALAYRIEQADRGQAEPLSGPEVTGAVRVIRDNAHQALTELGEVLAVLRADEPAGDGVLGRAAPPPMLADLPRLVDEARAAGQQVTLDVDGVLAADPPLRTQEQRTAYRVVQEGLTNARKHAPAAPVTVRVAGSPGDGLSVTVRNPLPARADAAAIPGTGAGLAGLAERVALDGGTLKHGLIDGEFELAARLPWR